MPIATTIEIEAQDRPSRDQQLEQATTLLPNQGNQLRRSS